MIPDVEEIVEIQDFQDFLHAGSNAIENEGYILVLQTALNVYKKGQTGGIGIRNFGHVDNNTVRGGFLNVLINNIPKGKAICGDKGVMNPDQKVFIFGLDFYFEVRSKIIPAIFMRNGRAPSPFICPASPSYGRHIAFPLKRYSRRQSFLLDFL